MKTRDSVKKEIVVRARIDNRRWEMLRSQSALENLSPSDFIRNALDNALFKDVAWQGQMQGALEVMRNEVKRTRRDVNIFMNMFMHWIEYYFTYTKPLDYMTNEQKKIMLEDGQRRAAYVTNEFKKKMRQNKPGLIEILLADFMEEDANGTENDRNSNGEDDGAGAGGAGAQREADKEPVQ